MKTDKQLLDDFIGDRNSKIFKEFYERYDTLLRERAFRFLKNRENTEDFLQEFWIRLLKEIEQIRTNEQGTAVGYLIVVMTHDLYDYLRIRELDTTSLDDYILDKLHKTGEYTYNAVEDEFFRNEVIATKDMIVRTLTEKDQLIYTLYTSRHLTVREIARVCSLSEGTIRNRLTMIKNNIKEQLQVLYTGSYILPFYILIQSNLLW
ncbi:MAG: RNA polymerase sigma factor [Mangrovibacterium sp.]